MSITAPHPIATTETTITFRRADWEAYLDALDDAADHASIDAFVAERDRVGEAEQRRLCYTLEEVRRERNGVSPVTIWRERAGLSQRALAAMASVSASYLAEIEAGRKPGSAAALSRLAKALRVPMDFLVRSDEQSPSEGEQEER